MTVIVFKTNNKVDELTVRKILFTSDDLIEALAEEAIVNMAEANIDMVLDSSEQYDTKEKIEAAFNCNFLNQIAYDMVNNEMDDFKSAVLEKIKEKQYQVNVTTMHFNGDEGEMSDVDVRIKF